jgi:DNA-binding MarR family transcriptional regulator
MDIKEIRTLKILQEFDAKDPPSQRYLSNKLNISLGLVNAFIKRLTQKGYFKLTTIPRNRVKYILTPKGVLEKSPMCRSRKHR